MVMATVDLLDFVQRGEAGAPDVAKLRLHIGKALRRSGAKHALAVASLIDSAPEYAAELVDYSEEIYPETDQEGGEA